MSFAAAVGPPLDAAQVVAVGRVKPGGIGYASDLTVQSFVSVIDARGSIRRGARGVVLRLPGIGRLAVRCADAAIGTFQLTPWAAGEGPPTVTTFRAEVRGHTSLTGLAAGFAIPAADAGRQTLQAWRVAGGGEAFQFRVVVTMLLTPTRDRCDVLAEATVATTGGFALHAPGHKVY